ncbi:penicillin-binding protein [Deinococcus metallilatus]|nr:penicillin-binding protein [Deinococcus metallilatus]
MPHMKRAPLLTLLLALGTPAADARVRLGEPLPAHPWMTPDREVIVVYSHDCGDLGELWGAVLAAGLPVRAVNAEDVAAPAPSGVNVWRGPEATAFARALHVGAYPTVLLVQGGRVLNAWEGNFGGDLGLAPRS